MELRWRFPAGGSSYSRWLAPWQTGWVSGARPNRAEHMLGQRWVVCLGREAWEVVTAALGVKGDWRAQRDAGEPLGSLVAAFHPSARVSAARLARPWSALHRWAA